MQSDHDRPLAPRGRQAVKLLREYVHAHEIAPQLVLCSTARRTVDTAQAVRPGGELSSSRVSMAPPPRSCCAASTASTPGWTR